MLFFIHTSLSDLRWGKEICNNYENILGIDVVKFDIPVKPGRHTALIIEVATKNYKQKELGYNPATALNERMLKKLKDK